MSKGLNKVELIGHLAFDPVAKPTKDGKALLHNMLAVNEKYKNEVTTEWFNITFFDPLASIVAQYCKKGSKIYVEGKFKTSKWTGKDGVEKTKQDVIVNSMILLDSNKSTSTPQQPIPVAKQPVPNGLIEDDIPF